MRKYYGARWKKIARPAFPNGKARKRSRKRLVRQVHGLLEYCISSGDDTRIGLEAALRHN